MGFNSAFKGLIAASSWLIHECVKMHGPTNPKQLYFFTFFYSWFFVSSWKQIGILH